ncbi:MAG: beta-N-acetylhexosaminidase [Acidobacteria bacterium]|nr:beta-N-acetylhexosaminidase [Acidobacteriota bacterium]
MDEGRIAAKLLVGGLPGPEITAETGRALGELVPAGLILFSRNIRSAAQVRELIAGARETCGDPLLVFLDQEGGRVNRLGPLHAAFSRLPHAREQAAWGEERLEDVWAGIGAALAALGFDVDFAPVVDLDAGEGENAIGPRSFGLDPRQVAEQAGAVLRGLRRAGVAGCLKHFPGLGTASQDTHLAPATSPAKPRELWERDVLPYRELRELAPFVMTAHAHYPEVDGREPLPATFSRRLLGEWLRERVGYDGVVVSDDLEMGAVARLGSPGELACRTLEAGADLALFCAGLDGPRRARDEIARRLARGSLDPSIVAHSGRRLAAVLAGYTGARGAPRPADSFQAAAARLDELLA